MQKTARRQLLRIASRHPDHKVALRQSVRLDGSLDLNRLIRIASYNPELQPYLLPIIREAAEQPGRAKGKASVPFLLWSIDGSDADGGAVLQKRPGVRGNRKSIPTNWFVLPVVLKERLKKVTDRKKKKIIRDRNKAGVRAVKRLFRDWFENNWVAPPLEVEGEDDYEYEPDQNDREEFWLQTIEDVLAQEKTLKSKSYRATRRDRKRINKLKKNLEFSIQRRIDKAQDAADWEDLKAALDQEKRDQAADYRKTDRYKERAKGTQWGVEEEDILQDRKTPEEAQDVQPVDAAKPEVPSVAEEAPAKPDYTSDIPRERALEAYEHISFHAEDRADQVLKDYQSHLEWMHKKLITSAGGDPDKEVEAGYLLDEYRNGYQSRFLAYLSAKSRTISPMITGPSNFPTKRNQKRLDSEDKRRDELLEWSNKFMKKAIRSMHPEKQSIGIQKDDALEQYEAKLARVEAERDLTKAQLKILRSKKLSPAEATAKYREMGMSESEIIALYKTPGGYFTPLKVAQNSLRNLSAQVRSVKEKIEAVKRHQAFKIDETRETYFEGQELSIIEEVDEDRLQIDFDDKPSQEVIRSLKSGGWKWSRLHGVWQRYLNENSYWALSSQFNISLSDIKAKHVNDEPADDDDIFEGDENTAVKAFEEREETAPPENEEPTGETSWAEEESPINEALEEPEEPEEPGAETSWSEEPAVESGETAWSEEPQEEVAAEPVEESPSPLLPLFPGERSAEDEGNWSATETFTLPRAVTGTDESKSMVRLRLGGETALVNKAAVRMVNGVHRVHMTLVERALSGDGVTARSFWRAMVKDRREDIADDISLETEIDNNEITNEDKASLSGSEFSAARNPAVKAAGIKLEEKINKKVEKSGKFNPWMISKALRSNYEFKDEEIIGMAKTLGFDHFSRDIAIDGIARHWRDKLGEKEDASDVMQRVDRILSGSLPDIEKVKDLLVKASQLGLSPSNSGEAYSKGETKDIRYILTPEGVEIKDISNAGKRGEISKQIIIQKRGLRGEQLIDDQIVLNGVLSLLKDHDFDSIRATAMDLSASLKRKGFGNPLYIIETDYDNKASRTDPYGTVPFEINNKTLKATIMPGSFSISNPESGRSKKQENRTRGTGQLWTWAKKNKKRLKSVTYDEIMTFIKKKKIKVWEPGPRYRHD